MFWLSLLLAGACFGFAFGVFSGVGLYASLWLLGKFEDRRWP